MADPEGGQFFHLPGFLDRLRETGAHDVLANLRVEMGGVLYHHRGVRIPGYNATFLWRDGAFELEVDGVGPRRAWARFDADHDWDVYLSQPADDEPFLAWMTDAEFAAEEAEEFRDKESAVGLGRFSFGLYLHTPARWTEVEERAREVDAPAFIHRPSGRMLVPDHRDLGDYEEVLPAELAPGEETALDHLGVAAAEVAGLDAGD